ncbi:MAG: hypothetical protein ABI051_14135 [Vicinamibacterales bacterium]
MREPRRIESAAATDRDTRAEALLVSGLDRYFSGQFEEAIHLWTRVLFLDRSHARARAYIDRARNAIAERQRTADEMLHIANDLLDRGDLAEALRVLGRLDAAGGPDERAAELRARIERLQRARASDSGPSSVRTNAVLDAVPVATPITAGTLATRILAALTGGALLVVAGISPAARDVLGLTPAVTPLVMPNATASFPVLSSSDVGLVRARTLYSHGRLAEALQALDRVTDPPSRALANQLRIEIQQQLLARTPTTPRAPASLPESSAGRR